MVLDAIENNSEHRYQPDYEGCTPGCVYGKFRAAQKIEGKLRI